MIHGFTAAYTKMRVNMIVNAFRQIGEEFCFPFAKWETVSPMAQLAIGSASLDSVRFKLYFINSSTPPLSSTEYVPGV